jgi:hypothetical protein
MTDLFDGKEAGDWNGLVDALNARRVKKLAEDLNAGRLARAEKPSAAQIRVLARMIQHGAKIRVFTWAVQLTDPGAERGLIIPHRTYNSMRVNGWIEPTDETCVWRVSDAGRKAAE